MWGATLFQGKHQLQVGISSSSQYPVGDLQGPDVTPPQAQLSSDQPETVPAARQDIDVLSAILDQAVIGMAVLTASDGRFVRANPCLCAMLRCEPRELDHCTWPDLIASDARQALAARFRLVTPIERLDGTTLWAECTLSPLPDAGGRDGLILLQALDLSQQRQDAALAEQDHKLLQTVLHHVDALVYIKDRQGRYLYTNPATQASLGMAGQNLIGLRDADLLPASVAAPIEAFDQDVLSHGGPLRREERLPHPDGREHIYLSEKLVCHQGEHSGFLIGFSTDITDLRQAVEDLATSEQHFRLLAENSGEVIFLLSLTGQVRWVSPSLTTTLGWLQEDWIGRQGTDFLIHRGESAQYRANIEQLLNGCNLVTARDQVRAKSGTIHWVETLASPYHNAAGVHDGFVARFRVVDDVVAAEEQLRLSEERFRLLAEKARDLVWTIEPDGRISYVSSTIEKLRGISPAELMAQPLHRIHTPPSLVRIQTYLDQVLEDCATGRTPRPFRGELEYRCRNGSNIWADVIALPITNDEGLLRYVLGSSRDITRRKLHEQQLNSANKRLNVLASTDTLTKIWNRHHLEIRIQQKIAIAEASGEPLSMILCDIDHFKLINDSFGHQHGDQILIEFSQRVSRHLRDHDDFGRWGGEEFVILVNNAATGAGLLAEKLRQHIACTPFPLAGTVTASFGVAQYRPRESTATWFQRADDMLYSAKTAGRDLVMVEQL